MAADDGEATARVGFGPDPEFFDILPNIDRINAYVAGEEFQVALADSTGSDGLEVVPNPPNGILAFLDLDVSGAATDAEAVDAANAAAGLVADHMNSLFAASGAAARETLEAQLAFVDAELLALEDERGRLIDVQAARVVTRFEDEVAFQQYGDAGIALDRIRVEIDTLLRQRSEAELDLAGLDRTPPDGGFEVLREATLDDGSADRPVWPIAAVVGAILGALVVLARDRDLLPIRESADLEPLRIGEETLLVDGSVRSVALMLRRKASVGDRILLAGVGMATSDTATRIERLLTTLETPAEVVTPDSAMPLGDVVTLIDGGQVTARVAEEALQADGAVLLVGSGRAQTSDLEGLIAEFSALGVDLHAVLITDPVSSAEA